MDCEALEAVVAASPRGLPSGLRSLRLGPLAEPCAGPLGSVSQVFVEGHGGHLRGLVRRAIRGWCGCLSSDPSWASHGAVSRPHEGGGWSGRRACCSWSHDVVSSVPDRRIGGRHWAAFRPSRNPPDPLHAVSTQRRATACDSRLRTRREARRLRDMRMAEERRRARSRKWPSEPTIKHLPASALGRTRPRQQPADPLRGFAKPDFPAWRALPRGPLGARQAVKACVQRR
jgi:hypothetical protein